jgi:hypothetical protein
VSPLVGQDLDAGGFHPGAGLGVAREGQGPSWSEREHVRSQGRELLLGHLDDADAARLEQLDEPHRHHPQVADRQVGVQHRQERHEVQTFRGPVEVRQVKGLGRDALAREPLTELLGAGRVGAVADPDQERPRIEEEHVAALRGAGWLERRKRRESGSRKLGGDDRRLAPAALLAG